MGIFGRASTLIMALAAFGCVTFLSYNRIISEADTVAVLSAAMTAYFSTHAITTPTNKEKD